MIHVPFICPVCGPSTLAPYRFSTHLLSDRELSEFSCHDLICRFAPLDLLVARYSFGALAWDGVLRLRLTCVTFVSWALDLRAFAPTLLWSAGLDSPGVSTLRSYLYIFLYLLAPVVSLRLPLRLTLQVFLHSAPTSGTSSSSSSSDLSTSGLF